MITHFLPIFFILSSVKALHFNGGTITWAAVDPHSNSSTVVVTITQTYSWSFPNIKCDINVPITSSGRSGENDNLTCVVDCSTDGGYSTKPINILTDCTFASASMGMLTSQKSKNVTLAAGAHFSLAYQGAAWRSLGSPAKSGLDWSILSAIDLRKRPDGFINTPPVASVASPQYVIVNQTTQIKIPVSDVNTGDDVRCRWGIFRQGYRRKRRSEQIGGLMHAENIWLKDSHDGEWNVGTGLHIRRKRGFKECNHADCATECKKECRCNCTVCLNANCNDLDKECPLDPVCPQKSTVPSTTRTTTTTSEPSTSETPGTKKSTSSFPVRQAIDECGGICFPSSTPNGTTLSNCTLSFKGLIPGAWYAVSIQVEDFINSTSTEPMSSVPVQFLIYVQPTPKCSVPPVMIVAANCLELQVGHPINFRIYAMNQCNSTISRVADIVVTRHIPGIQASNLTQASNFSFAFVTYSWTPQLNQIGSQIFCVTGVTSERVQSADYCVTFKIESYPGCTTTTTTTSSSSSTSTTTATTATTSTSTSSTSTTSTSTTSSSSSSTTSSSTTATTATSTTSSSTTTTTSSSTTSSSSTSTTTSSTTTSTSTSTTTSSTTTSTSTSTTTSSTTTSTSTSTTSSSTTSTSTSTSTSTTTSRTTSTSTTTSTTSITTTSRTTTTSVTTKSTTPTASNKKEKHWLFFLGLALLCLLLIICCACCLTYCFFLGGGRRRTKRRDHNHYKDRGTVDLSFRNSLQQDGNSNVSHRSLNEWYTESMGTSSLSLVTSENSRQSDVTAFDDANVTRMLGNGKERDVSTKAKDPYQSEENSIRVKDMEATGRLVSFQETIENIDDENETEKDKIQVPQQSVNRIQLTRASLPLTDQRSSELLSETSTSKINLASATFQLSTRSSLDSNKSMARASNTSNKTSKSAYDHIKVTKVYKR